MVGKLYVDEQVRNFHLQDYFYLRATAAVISDASIAIFVGIDWREVRLLVGCVIPAP